MKYREIRGPPPEVFEPEKESYLALKVLTHAKQLEESTGLLAVLVLLVQEWAFLLQIGGCRRWCTSKFDVFGKFNGTSVH